MHFGSVLGTQISGTIMLATVYKDQYGHPVDTCIVLTLVGNLLVALERLHDAALGTPEGELVYPVTAYINIGTVALLAIASHFGIGMVAKVDFHFRR